MYSPATRWSTIHGVVTLGPIPAYQLRGLQSKDQMTTHVAGVVASYSVNIAGRRDAVEVAEAESGSRHPGRPHRPCAEVPRPLAPHAATIGCWDSSRALGPMTRVSGSPPSMDMPGTGRKRRHSSRAPRGTTLGPKRTRVRSEGVDDPAAAPRDPWGGAQSCGPDVRGLIARKCASEGSKASAETSSAWARTCRSSTTLVPDSSSPARPLPHDIGQSATLSRAPRRSLRDSGSPFGGRRALHADVLRGGTVPPRR